MCHRTSHSHALGLAISFRYERYKRDKTHEKSRRCAKRARKVNYNNNIKYKMINLKQS